MSSSDNNKPVNPLPLICGLLIGSMPAMLWVPVLGKIVLWLLNNPIGIIFYSLAIYLPWMMGSIIGRMVGLETVVPIVFCIIYWGFLGMMVESCKHRKQAFTYIFTAHVLVPLVLVIFFNSSSNHNLNISDITAQLFQLAHWLGM